MEELTPNQIASVDMKECQSCGEYKPLDNYSLCSRAADKLQYSCRQCQTDYARMKYQTDPDFRERKRSSDKKWSKKESSVKKARNRRLKFYYGIDEDDWNDLYLSQNGCCAICGIHESKLGVRFHVDHDHETGVVRGLLCLKCNSGLGYFLDNVDFLRNAIGYLEDSDV